MRQQRTKRTAKNEPTKHMNDRGVSHVPLPLSDQGVSTSNARVWPCGTYTICSFLPRALDFSSGHILQYRTDQFRLHLDVIAISISQGFRFLVCSPLFCFLFLSFGCTPMICWVLQSRVNSWLVESQVDVRCTNSPYPRIRSHAFVGEIHNFSQLSWNFQILLATPTQKLHKTTGTTQFLSPLSHHPAGATEVS